MSRFGVGLGVTRVRRLFKSGLYCVWLLVCSNREECGGRERIKIDRSTGLFEDDYTVVFKKKKETKV